MTDEIRKKQKTDAEDGISSVIDQVITNMPGDFIIKPFLEAHRAEVKGMLLTEYNEAETMELFKEEGRREGRQEGAFEMLVTLVKDGLLNIKEAAKRAGITEETFRQKMAEK